MKITSEKKHLIIEYLLNGLTYEEVAKRLKLKIKTVKNTEKKYISEYFD